MRMQGWNVLNPLINMGSRFNGVKANLRNYLRKRGAKIDVKRKTVSVDVDSLSRVERDKLRELERWGYKVNEEKNLFSALSPPCVETGYYSEEESFVSFADEIIAMYY